MAVFLNKDFLELGRTILASGHALRFRARGWSMHPFIRDGDLLTVAPMGDSSLRRGDVVLYVAEGDKALVHRAVGKHGYGPGSTVLIKGDASLGLPERVPQEKVLGRVTVIERNERIRQVDSDLYRMVGLLFAVFSPFRRRLYSAAAKLRLRTPWQKRPGN